MSPYAPPSLTCVNRRILFACRKVLARRAAGEEGDITMTRGDSLVRPRRPVEIDEEIDAPPEPSVRVAVEISVHAEPSA